ncbi:MAG: aminopeptidase P N-terminal domain-containing protein, partial [Spirochaetia bacterium]|nr:aminopeptidase P N-terminal domain-containing protein [Spirochaetia bacterium]
PGADEVWPHLRVPIYQEPLVLFLTGVNQLNTALFLDGSKNDGEGAREILFLPPKDVEKEFWDGLRFGTGFSESEKEVKAVTGLRAVRNFNELNAFVEELAGKKRLEKLGLFWHERRPNSISKIKKVSDSKARFKKKCEALMRGLGKDPEKILVNAAPVAWHFRRPLDSVDADNALIANQKTGAAFTALLGRLRGLKNETVVRGILEGELLRRTSHGLSFPSIVAAGKNAAVLHYEKADSPIRGNELLLLDFGLKWQGLHADVTRTVPVNGKFNPLQKLLYTIVLEAQAFHEKHAKSGARLKEMNERTWARLEELLEERFIRTGGKMKRPYEKAPHGVSHLIGLAIHDGDPFGDYKDEPMEPGWLISNEPGLYGFFEMEIGRKIYREDVGIRIEDDLLVTKKGCVNLSRGIPKKIPVIERLILSRRSS